MRAPQDQEKVVEKYTLLVRFVSVSSSFYFLKILSLSVDRSGGKKGFELVGP